MKRPATRSEPTRSGPQAVVLPPQYGEALELAEAMLAAAAAGDWSTVAALRRTLPAMALSLSRRWADLPSCSPAMQRDLERARISAIRRILAVDDQIRLLTQPSLARLDVLVANRSAQRVMN